MKKAPTAAVEHAEDKAKQKYPRTAAAMKPTARKGSQGLPLETNAGNFPTYAQPISSLLVGPELVYKFCSAADGCKRKAARGGS